MFFRNKRQVIKDVVSTLQTEEDCRRNNNNNTKTAKRGKKKSGDDGNDILKRQQPYNPYFFPSSDVASLRTTTRTTNTPSQETKKMGTNGGQWEKPFIGLSPFSAKVTVSFFVVVINVHKNLSMSSFIIFICIQPKRVRTTTLFKT